MRYPSKSFESTVNTSIFDPHHVSSITKGRKNNNPRIIEVHIICI